MECRCQYAAMAMGDDSHRSGGKMAKLARFFQRGQKNQPIERDEEHRDLYALLNEDDWDSILSCDVEGEDILAACECAAKNNDIAGAVKLLSVMSSFTRFPYSQSPSLSLAWEYIFKEVMTHQSDLVTAMDMLTCAEKDERFDGEKKLLNQLIDALCTLQASSTAPSPAQQVAEWCRKEGHYSFGFDIALCSGNFDTAYTILSSMENTSKEHVLMLKDVASQSQDATRAASFVEICFQRGSDEFAFSLATEMRLWSVVEEKVKGGMSSASLLRCALRQSVLGEKWSTIILLLGHVSLQDARDVLLNISQPYNYSTVIDLLVERDFIPVAIQLACAVGMPGKASQIIQDRDFVMDPALSVSTACACFDSHCSPEEFLEKSLSRELLLHVLEAPQRKRFSENQWVCVLNFLDAGLPQDVVTQLFRRAAEEDAACLDDFIGRGADDDLLDSLLTHQPERDFSKNHMNCLAKLLYKQAGIDLKDMKYILTDEAVEVIMTKSEDMVSRGESKAPSPSGSDPCQGNPPSEQDSSKQTGEWSVSQPAENWSQAVLRLHGQPVSPWWYVMKAAQAARGSRHIRQLAVKAAHEGFWNCLIYLAIYGLRQHPLDLLISVLHERPERLMRSCLRQNERGESDEDDLCFHEGWKEFPHDVDIMNLHSRDLLEERHKMIFLRRALTTHDWYTLMRLSSLDLPLPARKAVFHKAMEQRQWLLAWEVFQQLPENPGPHVFQSALKELCETSEQLYSWMLESGLNNAYLAPEMYAGILARMDEKEAACQAEKQPTLGSPFWKRFRSKPKTKPPVGFQRPNPAVTEESRETITSTQGRLVRKAAARGEWGKVMKVYEGGMGEAVKTGVVEEAMSQDKWPVLTALVRRDPEAGIFYPQCVHRMLEAAVNCGAWSCIEAVVERLELTDDDRDRLFPYALGLGRWSLVLTLVKKGLRAQLREEALQTALRRAEWTFVMDIALHMAKTSPEVLTPRVKNVILKSMTDMIAALMPSPSPWATTFGLHLFSLTEQDEGHLQKGQGHSLSGSGAGHGEKCVVTKGEEEAGIERWTTDDGSTALQVAAGLRLWTVCKVLLCCGVNPRPAPTLSHPDDVILLALRDEAFDVVRMLLDSACLTCDVADQATRELLQRQDLDLGAEDGVALLGKLLESRGEVSPTRGEPPRSQASANVTQPSVVISDVSDDAKRLTEQVSKVLEEKKAKTFQPHVSRALQADQITLPHFLSWESLIGRGMRLPELRPSNGSLELAGASGGYCEAAGRGRPEVGPRVPLVVEKEPRASPVARLLPPLVF